MIWVRLLSAVKTNSSKQSFWDYAHEMLQKTLHSQYGSQLKKVEKNTKRSYWHGQAPKFLLKSLWVLKALVKTEYSYQPDKLEPQGISVNLANYKAALLDPESDKWLNAMNDGKAIHERAKNFGTCLKTIPPNAQNRWLDAELHLVHKAVDGEVAVIAVLYHYGHPDPLLSKIQSKLAQLNAVHISSNKPAQVTIGTITTKEIRKHSRKYYRYVGSFSTPPCTEGVIWNILGKVRSISREQVKELKAPLIFGCKRNARPAQPLNGRKIEMYDDVMTH
ncbi:alpha carbonic anhydrase 1, chloroplastic [Tanacetum coccineum]|uniref:Alpha carbonic anhydrase 1, chloroplastic n=1 Tax=Tanacetum coccineum TaxID=301880 RepID=A0ABQ5A1T4_9ASTR